MVAASPSRSGQPSGIATLLVAMLLLMASSATRAHEYWIEPLSYTRHVGDIVLANIRNGENYNGASLPFITDQIESADIYTESDGVSLLARLGDLPAVHFEVDDIGWHLVAIQTTPQVIRYTEQEKFESFVAMHDLVGLENLHRRLAADAVVTEHYTRYAKAIVGVVGAKQTNAELSGHLIKSILKFEWVVETESQFDNATVVLSLLNEGRPVIGRQAELYLKTNSAVTMKTYRTDATGLLHLVDLEPGAYLINAVVAEVNEERPSIINSEWASLTFEIK